MFCFFCLYFAFLKSFKGLVLKEIYKSLEQPPPWQETNMQTPHGKPPMGKRTYNLLVLFPIRSSMKLPPSHHVVATNPHMCSLQSCIRHLFFIMSRKSFVFFPICYSLLVQGKPFSLPSKGSDEKLCFLSQVSFYWEGLHSFF